MKVAKKLLFDKKQCSLPWLDGEIDEAVKVVLKKVKGLDDSVL